MKKFTIETSIKVNSTLNAKEMEQLEAALNNKVELLEDEMKQTRDKMGVEDFTTQSPNIEVDLSDQVVDLFDEEPVRYMISEVEKESFSVTDDIKKTYREGVPVKLANLFQTYPLIPYFEAKKEELSPKIQTLNKENEYDFYLIEVNFSSFLEKKQYLKQAELKITVKDDTKVKERKTRFYKMFPDDKYQKYFTANFKGKVGIDANLDFKLEIPKLAKLIDGGIEAKAEINTGVDWDLGEITFRKAKIETLGENDPVALWRYHMSSMEYKNDDYVSSAILQIPREAKKVVVKAELNVTPYKAIWYKYNELLPPIYVEPVKLNVELTSNPKE